MNEKRDENLNSYQQLTEHIKFLQLDQGALAGRLKDHTIPEAQKIEEVSVFVANFFNTVELFKSILGFTVADAENGKITEKDAHVTEGFAKNIDFIKKELLPFIEKKPEHGEPIAEDVLTIMKGRLTEIELLISGF